MINNDVEYFYEPVKNTDSWGEMSGRQLAFLCGLIKKYRPEKIVEIGVAAGGTTTVILKCISMLGLDTQMVSGDLSVELYRDKSKKTGYLAENYKKSCGGGQNVNHTLYTGKYAVEYLETIGNGIDFLILDTVHRLPGELLDFLACFPFLKPGCVVVLHDIALNHCNYNKNSIATKLLLDLVAAEKMIDIDVESLDAGIGAFVINSDTAKYIGNVFSALSITWDYTPANKELLLYRNFYSRYYTNKNIELFDLAVQLHQRCLKDTQAVQKSVPKKADAQVVQWLEKIKSKRVFIYGCGYYGKRFHDLMNQYGIAFEGYIISDGRVRNENNEKIYYLSEVKPDSERDIILICVRDSLQSEICAELQKAGVSNYILPIDSVFSYLRSQ